MPTSPIGGMSTVKIFVLYLMRNINYPLSFVTINDIVMQNATMDYETTSTIKLDNDEKIIEIKINDLYKYKNGNSINLELYNIGNIDAVVNNIKIIDVETSVNYDKIEINHNVKINDVIHAREEKIMNVLIKCIENNINENDYMNFKIVINYSEIKK